MAWIYLVIAGLLEIGWAIGLKYTMGWSRLIPSLLTAAAMAASFYFLSLALKTLPIGTVGAAILRILIFGESREIVKIVCILLIVAGIAGLKITALHYKARFGSTEFMN